MLRGIPILVLIFFVYYGLPLTGSTCSLWAAVTALTLFKTAQVIEIARGALHRSTPARSRPARRSA